MPIDIEYENWRQQGDPLQKPAGWTPASAHANASPPTVTTSEDAANDLSDIDQMINDLGLELPNDQASESYWKRQEQQLQNEYTAEEKRIQEQSAQRQRQQIQVNKEIMGQSKVALAELGLLSTEPGISSATNAVQYINDVETENQKEMDRIVAEEQQALTAAKNAKTAGQLSIAKARLDDARALREERNSLRLNAASEIRAMREAERADDRLAIEKLVEQRAAKRFKQEDAQRALDALVSVNFEGFDKLNTNEVKKIERTLGFVNGTIDGWYKQSQKLKAIEGWSSDIQTDKNTGTVTAIYTRINPDTGQPEFMKQTLGTFGERYAGSGSKTKTFELSAEDRGRLLASGISDSDITSLDSLIKENGLIPEITEYLSEDQAKVVREIYSSAKATTETTDTVVAKIKQGGYLKTITTSKEVNGKMEDVKEEVLDVDSIPDEVFSDVMARLQAEGYFDTGDADTQETLSWWEQLKQGWSSKFD